MGFNAFFELHPVILALIFLFLVLVFSLKGIALWRAGRNNQIVWFIFLFILNTAGILPLIYLAFFQKNIRKTKR